MTDKVRRRHSVAVMTSDSHLEQHHRFLDDDRVTSSSSSSTKTRESTVSKAVDRSNRPTKAPSGPLTATQVATDGKVRRHSVAVHPGAAVSVMETSGTRQAPAKARKGSLPLRPSSSTVIDEFIDAADKALMRRCPPLPAGSEIHRLATLQEIAGEEG